MNKPATTLGAASLALDPLTPTIGAEVSGVDLSRPLAPETVTAIHAALLQWKVLFFRGQHITTEQHIAFARRFGELELHPFRPHKPGHPEMLVITHDREHHSRDNTWRSDVSWREIPSMGSIVRATKLSPIGGDTLFADMAAAYEGLPEPVKERIDGRFAVHDFGHFRTVLRKAGKSEEEIEEFNKAYPPVEHPIARTHPETGAKAIYVNAAFTEFIVGMDKDESDSLLAYLYARAAISEYQCRFRWDPGAIAFWDNRVTQHYAMPDDWPAVRRMERATIIGDRPR